MNIFIKPWPSYIVSKNVIALSQNIKKKEAGGAKTRPVSGGLLPPPPGAKAGGLFPPPGGQQTVPTAQPYAGDNPLSFVRLYSKNVFLKKNGLYLLTFPPLIQPPF